MISPSLNVSNNHIYEKHLPIPISIQKRSIPQNLILLNESLERFENNVDSAPSEIGKDQMHVHGGDAYIFYAPLEWARYKNLRVDLNMCGCALNVLI